MSVIKKYILNDLQLLDRMYTNAKGPESVPLQIFYSKIAVIELCGWFEESLDIIANRSVKGAIESKLARKERKQAVSNNYGFDYENNFAKMMFRLVGVKAFSSLESHLVSTGHLQQLESLMTTLKSERNSAAHTHISGVTRSFVSPSVSIQRLNQLYPILRSLYTWSCKYCPAR